jgi:hypothetical protein
MGATVSRRLAQDGCVGTAAQQVFSSTFLTAGNHPFKLSRGRVEGYVVDLSKFVPAIAQSSLADQFEGAPNGRPVRLINWSPERTVIGDDHGIRTKPDNGSPVNEMGFPTLPENKGADGFVLHVNDEATDVT